MALFIRKNKQPKEQFRRSINRSAKGDIGIYIIVKKVINQIICTGIIII